MLRKAGHVLYEYLVEPVFHKFLLIAVIWVNFALIVHIRGGDKRILDDRFQLAWALVLSMVEFELGSWLWSRFRRSQYQPRPLSMAIGGLALILMGLAWVCSR
jgi:hypothetical protein